MLLILVIAACIGIIPGAIAANKGHNFGLWWLFGAALFIVALPCAIMLKPIQQNLELQQIANGGRKCPHCAEIVKAEALVCRFCQRDLPAYVHVNPYAKLSTYRDPSSR